jgi:hypothetical protein
VVALCIFGITLVVAVLLSGLAGRRVLSVAVLFLVVGFISGEGVLASISSESSNKVVSKFGELVLGIALGVLIPWLAIRLESSRFFSAANIYEPLHAFAVGLVVLALASLTHANEFLTAFVRREEMMVVM